MRGTFIYTFRPFRITLCTDITDSSFFQRHPFPEEYPPLFCDIACSWALHVFCTRSRSGVCHQKTTASINPNPQRQKGEKSMSTAKNETRCYTVADLQEILKLSRISVYELLKKNEFRSIMVGGKYRISKKSFDAWLDGCEDEESRR